MTKVWRRLLGVQRKKGDLGNRINRIDEMSGTDY